MIVVADVAMFYGERSGGIRTYLDEKARFAAATGAFEHHVIVPGRRPRHAGGRHEVRSLRLAASNGYRVPLGAGALKDTLRALRPDHVLLHDPFWGPHGVTAHAHALGAHVVAVHHASPALNAAAIPGPDALYLPLLRRVYRRAYRPLDGVMSVVDPGPDTGRPATIALRFGLHAAFRPAPAARGDHLLYVGRLSREKRVDDLFAAAARLDPPRPVHVAGDGPARRLLAQRAERLGVPVRFLGFVRGREALAALYREAACVVDPGPHETFGLVVFEAAASGARVVACDRTPAVAVADGLIDTFAAADVGDLVRAIERALARPGTAATAAALAGRSAWARVFEDELDALERQLRPRRAGARPAAGGRSAAAPAAAAASRR
jgi:alpha-1,6-mannosyltransferase